MKKVLFIILSLFSAIQLSAQAKYEQGWIIDSSGNRVDCLINNVGWVNTPDTFDYKLDESSATITAGPSDVKAFSVGGYLFESYDLELDTSTGNLTSFDTIIDAPLEKRLVFLEVLCDGWARLYRYSTPKVKENFFVSTEESPEPLCLIDRTYYQSPTEVRYNRSYRQQLYSLLGDRGVDEKEFKGLDYDKQFMVRLFDKVNGVKREKTPSHFALGAYASYKHKEAKYTGDIYSAGLSFEYFLPVLNEKMSVTVSPSYTKYTSARQPVETIDLPISFRYRILQAPSFKPYLELTETLWFPMDDYSELLVRGGFDRFGAKGLYSNFSWGAGITFKNRIDIGIRHIWGWGNIEFKYYRQEFLENVWTPFLLGLTNWNGLAFYMRVNLLEFNRNKK